MPRAKVVDFDYYQFQPILQRAADAGRRIEPRDGARWDSYIKQHAINLVAATAIARQRYASADPVIIDEGRDFDGLYFLARDEEGCQRLIWIE